MRSNLLSSALLVAGRNQRVETYFPNIFQPTFTPRPGMLHMDCVEGLPHDAFRHQNLQVYFGTEGISKELTNALLLLGLLAAERQAMTFLVLSVASMLPNATGPQQSESV